jgi:bifunctional DNA-binding transcriptional regulator/antitoxin component of YhaV-PrlF toxin-antitoxin module
MNEPHRFRGVIEPARGGGAVVLVPSETAAALGGLRQMRVSGTVNGTEYRSSTMPYRGALYMGVHKATREAAGVSVGDEIEIVVARDDSPRVLELAPELEIALAAEPDLRARFEGLSFSRRRELADPVSEARRPETRARRVDAALDRLREMA